MKFIKDLLIIEIETTGPDSERDAVIQLSALVLDRDNLLEKGVFNTYVRTSLLEKTLRGHAEILEIPFEVMQKSPKANDAVKKIMDAVDLNATLTLQTVRSLFFLRALFKKANVLFPADPHVFELWTLEYMASQSLGLKKIPTLQTFKDHYGLKVKNPHNALERARLEAEVLRRIIK